MSTRKSLLLQDRLRPSASCRLLELRASPRSSARQRASKGCSRLWLSSQALSRHARSRACFRAVSASRKEAETNSRSTVRLESARAAGESSSRGVPAGSRAGFWHCAGHSWSTRGDTWRHQACLRVLSAATWSPDSGRSWKHYLARMEHVVAAGAGIGGLRAWQGHQGSRVVLYTHLTQPASRS